MALERHFGRPSNELGGVNDRADSAGRAQIERRQTRTTTTTTSEIESKKTVEQDEKFEVLSEVARVEHLGRQANGSEFDQVSPIDVAKVNVEGNKFVTSLGTIAAQSSESRIVVAILKDGRQLQLRVQEMRPAIFEVGTNLNECRKFQAEHRKLMANLAKHKQAPIENWLTKYKKIQSLRPEMGAELRLVYLCMAENLQGCWQGVMLQLETRLQLLDETAKFYSKVELLAEAIKRADAHVQSFRRELLEGPGSIRFSQAANELKQLNRVVADEFVLARRHQKRLVELIGKVATGNLADSRANLLISDGQNLIDFISRYIEPLERRKLQLENVTKSNVQTSITATSSTIQNSGTNSNSRQQVESKQRAARPPGSQPMIRQIDTLNDLQLVERWLTTKVDQLNSSLLSGLGASAQDTRSILNKHEQVALECSAIEEVLLNFRGKSIHSIKPNEQQQNAADPADQRPSLLEQQRQLASKARDVISILEARIVLLRRTIDFYSRAKEASLDIGKMTRRLQADNSLQSVQFVTDELELKDVSSVVASGATIISELQQLQLAQQHGQRSKAVGLQLETGGIRLVIDQLNQELAHLKTVLSQRRLVLLNEDAGKMAQNYSNKCQQLRFWLDSSVRSFLLANCRIPVEVRSVRAFIDQHEELHLGLQQKTLEVEALLRLLSSLTESFDAKSQKTDEIQRETDELRREWISVTSCLERRLDLARKYLAILTSVAELSSEIDLLGGGEPSGEPRSRTPDERSQEDIQAHVSQTLTQLANQVRNFTLDGQRSNTALVYAGPLETKPAVNDVNKQQIIGHASGSQRLLEERLKTTINRLNAAKPRRWSREEPQVACRQTDSNRSKLIEQPKFARELSDAEVEPFSTVVLECELAAGPNRSQPVRVDWLLNNKKIPHTIRHSVSSEANWHRLTISQFSPVCCGQYSARAINQLNGSSAISSCRLRLSGIREDESNESAKLAGTRQSTSSAAASSNKWQQQANRERALQRIIQGVESPMSHDEQFGSEQANISSTTQTSTTQFPVIRLNYDGNTKSTTTNTTTDTSRQRLSFIDSPVSSVQSGSVSRSPLDGTPQPPVFMQALTSDKRPDAPGAQAGLVCVVIGNPPPNVEWLHEGRPIAAAKCPRPATSERANICKLTIETVNDKTLGRYVCRATNKLGQSSTALTLS